MSPGIYANTGGGGYTKSEYCPSHCHRLRRRGYGGACPTSGVLGSECHLSNGRRIDSGPATAVRVRLPGVSACNNAFKEVSFGGI